MTAKEITTGNGVNAHKKPGFIGIVLPKTDSFLKKENAHSTIQW